MFQWRKYERKEGSYKQSLHADIIWVPLNPSFSQGLEVSLDKPDVGCFIAKRLCVVVSIGSGHLQLAKQEQEQNHTTLGSRVQEASLFDLKQTML